MLHKKLKKKKPSSDKTVNRSLTVNSFQCEHCEQRFTVLRHICICRGEGKWDYVQVYGA
jgi:ribosomal protein S14